MHDIRFHRHSVNPNPHRATRRVIAICGKGGVGKTAFSAMLVNELAKHEAAGSILAVDADPALGLALALGAGNVPTIAELREVIIRAAQSGEEEQEQLIADNLDRLVFDSVVELETCAFLAMGHSSSLGCYCSVNDILRDAIEILASRFDTIVIDGEAGLEQINRQVLGRITDLLLLSDGSKRSMNSVRLLKEIALRDDVVDAEGIQIVFNRSIASVDELLKLAEDADTPVLGHIPFDQEVVEIDASSNSLSKISHQNPAAHEVAHIAAHLLNLGHCHHH